MSGAQGGQGHAIFIVKAVASMGKKSKTEASAEESVVEQSLTETGVSGLSYEEKVERALPIAHPMATRKLAKRAYKVTKKCKCYSLP